MNHVAVELRRLFEHGEMPASLEKLGCQVRRLFRDAPGTVGHYVVVATKRNVDWDGVGRQPRPGIVVRSDLADEAEYQFGRELAPHPSPIKIVGRIIKILRTVSGVPRGEQIPRRQCLQSAVGSAP